MKYISHEAYFMIIYERGGDLQNLVKEYRLAKGLTQQQLAELAHVTSRTIISLEKGQYSPSLMLAYKLSLILDVSMEELYCLAENKRWEDQIYEDLS